MGTRGSWWAHRAHQCPAVVRGRSPRTQKSQPLCELVSTRADTAFGKEGCDGERRRKLGVLTVVYGGVALPTEDGVSPSLPDDPTERAIASEGDERGGEAPEQVPSVFMVHRSV